MPTLISYWWPLLAAIFIAAVVIGWRFDRAAQYRQGYAEAAEKIRLENAQFQAKQAVAVLEKERRQAADLAASQAEVEKEKQNAEAVIISMRGELDRLRQYARNKSTAGNLPKTASPAAAPDEAAAKGWNLFGKCAAEYAGMAEVADRQRNDLSEWQAYGRVVTQ